MALIVTPHSGIFLASHALAPVSIPFSTKGGKAPYTYYVSSGELPPGLTLNPNSGLLSGTPTGIKNDEFVSEDGFVYNFNIKVTDSSVPTRKYVVDTYTYTVSTPRPTVIPYVPILLQSSSSVIENSVDNIIPIKSALNPTRYEIVTVPDHGTARLEGLTLKYTPNQDYLGVDDITIVAYNSSGPSNDVSINVSVMPRLPGITESLENNVFIGSVDSLIDLNVKGIYDTINITTPTSNGSIYIVGANAYYTPNQGYIGPDSFTFSASNISGTVMSTINIIVQIPEIIALPAAGILPPAVCNTEYQPVTLTASGGVEPYTVIVLNGSLPEGMQLVANVISGTPTTPGKYNFNVAFIDNHFPEHFTVYNDYQLNVYPNSNFEKFQWFTMPGKLFTAFGGESTFYELQTSNDLVTYKVIAGSLPAGFELLEDGTIVGNPGQVLESISHKFVIRATRSDTMIIDGTFTIDVVPGEESVGAGDFSHMAMPMLSTTASTNIYVSPFMPIEKRIIYEDFISNPNIFVPEYLYEGGYTSPKLYLEYGIQELEYASDFEIAMSQNFYDKTLYFGNLKSLPVYNNIDEYLYDLVYIELVDPLDGVKLEVSFQGLVDTPPVHPNSLKNMRTRLETIILFPRTAFEAPIQINLDVPIYILNARTAGIDPFNGVILCKAQAGKGARIIARIKKQIKKKLFNFNQFDFTFDRIVVETSSLSTASTYLVFPKRTI
jgi:hypothetical protein